MTPVSLRPYLSSDATALANLFRASVETLAEEDYSAAQCEAWSTLADDEERFAKKLGEQLTLVALVGGEIAGFASLKGADMLDMLYVAPRFARKKVATTLVDALEKLAAARGAGKIATDASDTAKPLFAARGYEATARNVLPMGDESIANTSMSKALGPAEPRGTLQ